MKQMTILLLEDEPVIALDLKLELEREGHHVMAAPDAEAAFLLGGVRVPDLVILNFLYVNYTDGMTLAQLLRDRFLAKVLFITGARQEDLAGSADFDAGHEVLHKPFNKVQFRLAMNVVMQETGPSRPF